MRDMPGFLLGRDRARPLPDGVNDFGYLFILDHRRLEAFDVPDKITDMDDIGRHSGLELTLTHEHDQGLEVVLGDAGQVGKRLGMLIVLPQGILKPVLAPEVHLGPLCFAFVAEDPALIRLGFQHKDTVPRHDHVVDLRGAVRRRQHDIRDQVVNLGIQQPSGPKVNAGFTQPAFEPGQQKEPEGGAQNGDQPEEQYPGQEGGEDLVYDVGRHG